MVVIPDKNIFFALTRDFEYIPYSQSEGWYNYLSCTKPDEAERFVFLADDADKPTIACFGLVMKFAWLKLVIIEGECLQKKGISINQIRNFYEGVTSLGFDFIEVNSLYPYNAEYEIGIRQAGYLRPIGMFSMPLSLWVNLQQEKIQYNQNWKRNIKKASTQNLSFEVVTSPTEKDVSMFFDLYKDLLSQKGFAHYLPEKQIACLLFSSNFGLAYVKDDEHTPVAAIIFHKDEKAGTAGLLYAAKSKAAETLGATFLMYDSLFAYLKEKGYTVFDMEKLVPSTHSTNSVFLFKNGIKDQQVLYMGEWAWYKSRMWGVLMYFVKKYLFKKRET